MSITGKQLYNKLRELCPDLSSGITPEILSKVCDTPGAQPFVEWFYKNVSSANILSKEELKIKNTLQDADEWLEDEALDAALVGATRDCPDLLQLVNLDNTYREDLFTEYQMLRENCREDKEYLHSLRQSTKNLKKMEHKLDDDIEEAKIVESKERIEMEKTYDNCSIILKEFDRDNCQFSKDVDTLLNTYADTAKSQGNSVLWSQMPIDLFIKQIELYNHYLGIHIKKQFGVANKKEDEDSDYVSLISDIRDKQVDEKMHELSLCKTNLANSKIEEIKANVEEEFYVAMLQSIEEIYNGGNFKVPGDSKLHDEVMALSIKRDILEQSVEFLRDQQLPEIASQFAEVEIIKILKNDALARIERRKTRLEKLKNLYFLTGEHGHAYVNLLCTLMEMQYHSLREVTEFIADARYYISTEYKLSSTRCEIMQQQQDEYTILLTQYPKTCNAFNQIFISMMLGDEIMNEALSAALQKYNDLIADTAEKKIVLETYLNNKIDKLQKLKKEVDKDYMTEIQTGPTNNLKPISYKISTSYEEISAIVQEVQTDITRIRNKFKERMRSDVDLEREKDILWQRFLVDPDTLRMRYEEAEKRANKSHFRDTLGNESSS